MQFLADVELLCEDCKGTRYKPEILAVRYHGKNIHDVLNMTVKEALGFFTGVPKLVDKLRVLEEVGLGYLRLGQSATTLSGGEAQRMKLAAHLQPHAHATACARIPTAPRSSASRTCSTSSTSRPPGLHFDDVSKLLAAFKKLIDAGGSIVVIEHNLDVIKVADWVIDLGPEGGERGGEVVAIGTPEEIAANRALLHRAMAAQGAAAASGGAVKPGRALRAGAATLLLALAELAPVASALLFAQKSAAHKAPEPEAAAVRARRERNGPAAVVRGGDDSAQAGGGRRKGCAGVVRSRLRDARREELCRGDSGVPRRGGGPAG